MPPASPPPSFRSHGLNHADCRRLHRARGRHHLPREQSWRDRADDRDRNPRAWESGTDSSGNPAADLAVTDSAGDHITVPISFDLG